MALKASTEEQWRAMLTGEVRGLCRVRSLMMRIPSDPRCKLCAAPFGAPGRMIVRLVGFGRSSLNRRICNGCIRHMTKTPGGAEIEISLLFADVRGSTALAERVPPQEFSQLMARYYGSAAKVVDRLDGVVDKFVGDEVVALFVPAFTGGDHAQHAVDAAQELMRATGNDGGAPWVPIGAGVHTGIAYVGTVGEGDACDFTALGDPVNTTARLAAEAGPGEILISAATASAARLNTTRLEPRVLALRGREETIEAWVARG